jgi:hypothetical protein
MIPASASSPAVLLKVTGDERTRLAVRRLSQPSGVVVTRDGKGVRDARSVRSRSPHPSATLTVRADDRSGQLFSRASF